jgi:GTP-binding protein EngB required for normal cell division
MKGIKLMVTTNFYNKCSILSDLWLYYRDNENLKDFIRINSAGFAFAYLVNESDVEISDEEKEYVDKAYKMFCYLLGIDANKEYDSLDEMMAE